MTGYVRADTGNSIENGQIANASDLDAEFNAIQTAFSTSSGHRHDGTSAEGAPITVIGPAQDFVATVSAFQPKNSGVYDLGSTSVGFRDGYLTRNFSVGGNATITGTLSVTGVTTLGTVNITTGTITTLNVTTLNLGGTAVTSTAGELNILDGATISTVELNYLGGVTSPVQTQINSKQATITGAATSIVSSNLTANRVVTSDGSGKVTQSTVTTTELANLSGVNTNGVQGFIPVGGIIMWSGTIANIPSGWALCNGLNGTPNLQNKMIIGAGDTYSVGATGGSTTITLVEANLPAHTHTFSGNTGNQSANHTHNGTTSTNGAHTHTQNSNHSTETPVTPANRRFGLINSAEDVDDIGGINAAGDHNHTFTTSGVSSDHTHAFSGTTSSVGSGTAVNILNPYYALAFIMKL